MLFNFCLNCFSGYFQRVFNLIFTSFFTSFTTLGNYFLNKFLKFWSLKSSRSPGNAQPTFTTVNNEMVESKNSSFPTSSPTDPFLLFMLFRFNIVLFRRSTVLFERCLWRKIALLNLRLTSLWSQLFMLSCRSSISQRQSRLTWKRQE